MPTRRRKPVQEPEDTRTAVLRAAETLFAQKGYMGARVAEIADEAGVDKRLVFYYFGTKQGLYAEILESFFNRAEPLFEAFFQKRGVRARQVSVERFLAARRGAESVSRVRQSGQSDGMFERAGSCIGNQ